MHVRLMAICCVMGVASVAAVAQMGDAKTGSAAGTIVTPARAMDSELSLIEWEMMGAVKAMPEEKFGFAPSAAIFVPGQTTEFATVQDVCAAGNACGAGELPYVRIREWSETGCGCEGDRVVDQKG